VVAAAEDVNGDGYPDLLIGAPGTAVLGLQPQGRVYVIFGGPSLQSMDLANISGDFVRRHPAERYFLDGA
jgi:hypothetical protein